MKIVFRTDSSVEIGSGHVMRCLTLADALNCEKADIAFITRKHPGNLNDYIRSRGYPVFELPVKFDCLVNKELKYSEWLGTTQEKDANETSEILKSKDNINLLIIDHYAIDESWEKRLRPFTDRIMVIDDLADRKHDCDILLDQNLNPNMDSRYDGLVPETCKKLLGPKYVLLRPEFIEARKNLKKRDGSVNRLLIFFGGSDQYNLTSKAIDAVKMLDKKNITFYVVVGASNPHKEKIKDICNKDKNFNFHCQISNMAELMLNADLAIGASGSTTWERCCLGLPSLIVTLADNQKKIADLLMDLGVCQLIGDHNEITNDIIYRAILDLIDNPPLIKKMSESAMQLVDSCFSSELIMERGDD